MSTSEPKPKVLSNVERIAKLEAAVFEAQAGIEGVGLKLDTYAARTEAQIEAVKAERSEIVKQTAEYTVERIKASGGTASPTVGGGGSIVQEIIGFLRQNQGQPVTSGRVQQINDFAERIEVSMFKRMQKDLDKLMGLEGPSHVEISH